ncbi:hypothetical protein F2Q68_00036700 [Brassica cretica]|uniref:Uncharacterized protein n=1 Tax=Brassica cretica TaxID=69181 RepID=A0A8S9H617_BRACR|nr:hypothetical protein F2Q68_00036700 [Brassica cretica]
MKEDINQHESMEKNVDSENRGEDKDVDKGGDMRTEGSSWSLVSPAKMGRSQTPTQKKTEEILISTSKFSVLDEEDVEEGEFLEEEKSLMEEEIRVEEERSESDLLEDNILDQQEKDKERTRMKKGQKRGRKPKAQDASLKSTRVSRQNY